MKKEKTYLTAQYFLNHKLEPEEVRRQIREFADKGYQGVFAHARQGLLTPYMSQSWWDIIDVIVKECESTGMKFQIWDEDYFPSGIAGGRTAWEHPELAARNMNFTIHTFDNCDEIELDFKKGYLLKAFALELDSCGKCLESIDITGCCGTRRQEWTERSILHTMYSPLLALSGNPHWQCSFTDNRFAVCWKTPKKTRYAIIGVTVDFNFSRTCLMDPRTTRAMLDSTYEEYYKRYGGHFGGLVEGVFFDEPSTGCEIYPWSADFAQEFLKDHSYGILENLAHLAWDIDKKSPVVRSHFRETQHRLMTANYLEQSREWCSSRNIVFRGHLTRTEWLSLTAAWWPNELRCYKYVDIPCCDPLGKAYGFRDTAPYHTGIKVVSSAARIFGKEFAGSDCLAVIGDEVSLRDLKGMLDYQMALGINFFVMHGYSYSIDGPRKDEVPPSLFYQHSEWDHMGQLSAYIRKTCRRLSEAAPVCRILMLYPSTSLAALQKPDNEPWSLKHNSWSVLEDEKRIHTLVDDMLSAHRDFDFIDEITLSELVSEKGTLSLRCDYGVIVLPYVKFIPENAAKALYRYLSGGGRVVLVEDVPIVLSAKPERLNTKGMELVNGNPADILPPIAEIRGDGAEDIFAGRYLEDNKNLFFLYNRSKNVFRGSCDGIPVEIQPVSGLMVDEKYRLENVQDKIHGLNQTRRDLFDAERLSECAVSAALSDNPKAALTRRTPKDCCAIIKSVENNNFSYAELNSGWQVEFGENQIAMNYQQVFADAEIANADYTQGKPYDLSLREKNPVSANSLKVLYRYRLTSSGNISDVKIVMDESAVSGNWKVYVNGTLVDKWAKKRFYDCNNIFADVKLKQGNSPLVNVIDIITEGGVLKEAPYLYGDFRCSYPHGHRSFPDISATEKVFEAGILSDWAVWGYPSYSGRAVYTKIFEIAEGGTYMLDLGRVEDIAEIAIDDISPVILPWPPYKCKVKLSPGLHRIRVSVTNAPGNMFRNAALPAGLLGPVSCRNTDDR